MPEILIHFISVYYSPTIIICFIISSSGIWKFEEVRIATFFINPIQSSIYFIFDITNQNSFDDIDIWVNEVISKCPDIPIVICGNKFDLVDARSIEKEIILEYIRLRRFDYIETSALSAHNVDKLFCHASRLSHQFSNEHMKFREEYIL